MTRPVLRMLGWACLPSAMGRCRRPAALGPRGQKLAGSSGARASKKKKTKTSQANRPNTRMVAP
jgi:hypothetical protein